MLVHTVRGGLIRRLEQTLDEHQFDINFTQFRALKALSLHESMSATELARTLEHDAGALTRVLDRLQDKGYVQRRPSEQDRRAVVISLTVAGRALWNSIETVVWELNRDVLSVLTPVEQDQLFTLMHKLRDSLPEGQQGVCAAAMRQAAK